MAETKTAGRAAASAAGIRGGGGGVVVSGFRVIRTGIRDFSPDSVILASDNSNFSLLSSSASASADRCSFASDALDHDSILSDSSQNLAGNEAGEGRDRLSGPDLIHLNSDSNKFTVHNNNAKNSDLCRRKADKAKVLIEEESRILYGDDEIQSLDSARNSFSVALRECQERRSRSEALTKKSERRRPASLDLNNSATVNAVGSSPRLGAMKKGVVSSRKSGGSYPSPGTPNYRHGSVGINKGWSSERVPLSGNGVRRQVGAALLPLNNGRTLPSKWEDAERWIFSPVGGDGSVRPSYQHPYRRPKSKSGPLGPPGLEYYSLYSPAVRAYDGSNVNSIVAASPFSTGVVVADGLSIRGGGDVGTFTNKVEPCIARSASVHGCTDLICQSSLTPSLDEKTDDDATDDAKDICRVVSRRDMATQMSPVNSSHSSPRRLPFSPPTPSNLPLVEVKSLSSTKSEVRDVQVDERVTVTRWSKKQKPRLPGKVSEDVDNWQLTAVETGSSGWELSETSKNISKTKREEAKITAWENLQQAKAEAAMRKLEMKLEKKRSSSMDKIMNKLRSAQKKAQEMRSALVAHQGNRVTETSHKVVSVRKTRQMGSLSGCFACHAF